MTEQQMTIAVIGAGGKMGMRVSNNLQRSSHLVRYAENSPGGQQRTTEAGRTVTDSAEAVAGADVVILAVPDVALDGFARGRRASLRARCWIRPARAPPTTRRCVRDAPAARVLGVTRRSPTKGSTLA